ncbi:unnamed protein product [Pieris brassicae]|uniref:Uncharacterized protein n=1 Tax=Pieris brassicae TaxID=7116 RepID=A0A9P0T030_PIEBR|nr:unnamed protein product [Pieris brassicae]
MRYQSRVFVQEVYSSKVDLTQTGAYRIETRNLKPVPLDCLSLSISGGRLLTLLLRESLFLRIYRGAGDGPFYALQGHSSDFVTLRLQ